MDKTVLAFLAAAGLALGAGSASAATVTTTFDFNGSTITPTNQLSFTSADGGVNVDVTGRGFFTNSGDLSGDEFLVGRYAGGLGICSGFVDLSAVGRCGNDDHQIDGFLNEMAVLSFDQDITLVDATFSLIGGNDDFAIRIYSGTPTNGFNGSIDPGSNGTPTYTFSSTIVGDVIGLGAQTNRSEFKLRGLSVQYEVAPVPLPAAGWMLFAGLGGLVAMKRRKKVEA